MEKAKDIPSMLEVLAEISGGDHRNLPSTKLIDDDERSLSHILDDISDFLLN
jgi:hypothetical protein